MSSSEGLLLTSCDDLSDEESTTEILVDMPSSSDGESDLEEEDEREHEESSEDEDDRTTGTPVHSHVVALPKGMSASCRARGGSGSVTGETERRLNGGTLSQHRKTPIAQLVSSFQELAEQENTETDDWTDTPTEDEELSSGEWSSSPSPSTASPLSMTVTNKKVRRGSNTSRRSIFPSSSSSSSLQGGGSDEQVTGEPSAQQQRASNHPPPSKQRSSKAMKLLGLVEDEQGSPAASPAVANRKKQRARTVGPTRKSSSASGGNESSPSSASSSPADPTKRVRSVSRRHSNPIGGGNSGPSSPAGSKRPKSPGRKGKVDKLKKEGASLLRPSRSSSDLPTRRPQKLFSMGYDPRKINFTSGMQRSRSLPLEPPSPDTDDPYINCVKVASVDELIAKLLDDDYLKEDEDYVQHFLYLYRFFIKPKTLLKRLQNLYRQEPKGATPEALAQSQAQLVETRKRIIAILKKWIEISFNDLKDDSKFMYKFMYFVNNVLTYQEKVDSKIGQELTRLIEQRNMVGRELKEKEERKKRWNMALVVDHKNVPLQKKAGWLNFMELHTKDLVEELALIERNTFVAIKPTEFLGGLWDTGSEEDVKRQENYRKWETQQKRIEQWVITEMLTRPNLNERTQALKKFIDIAKRSFKIGNLNTTSTILEALKSPEIQRLTRTWENLAQRTMAAMDKILFIMKPLQQNYIDYVTFLRDAKSTSILPSVNIFTREIKKLQLRARVPPERPRGQPGASEIGEDSDNTTGGESHEHEGHHDQQSKQTVVVDDKNAVIDFMKLREAIFIMQQIQFYQEQAALSASNNNSNNNNNSRDRTDKPSMQDLLHEYLLHPRILPAKVQHYFSLHCESGTDRESKEIQVDDLEPDVVYAINHGKFFVKSGKRDKLAQKVLDPWLNELDPDFCDAFVLNRSLIMPAKDFLDHLTKEYMRLSPYDLVTDLGDVDISVDTIKTRMRIIEVIRLWMEVELTELKQDPEFVKAFSNFCDKATFVTPDEAGFFISLRERFKPKRPYAMLSYREQLLAADKNIAGGSKDKNGARAPPAVPPNIGYISPAMKWRRPDELLGPEGTEGLAAVSGPPPGEGYNRSRVFDKQFPKEAARAFILLDQAMLKAIPPKELVKKAYIDPTRSPSFKAMIDRFNGLSFWVASCIVVEKDTNKRAQIITQFVRLAWILRNLNDFHTTYSIVGALNSSAITRLKQTWAAVSGKTLTRWKELEELFNFAGNFRNYRDALSKCKPPVVPFLGDYSKNLFAIEEHNPPKLEDKVTINFERFVMLMHQIRAFQAYQRNAYDLQVDDGLYDYLFSGLEAETLSEEEIHRQSAMREGKTDVTGVEAEHVVHSPLLANGLRGNLRSKERDSDDSDGSSLRANGLKKKKRDKHEDGSSGGGFLPRTPSSPSLSKG
ncbi:cell division cycle-related protein [Balamuthia mandrillaris]